MLADHFLKLGNSYAQCPFVLQHWNMDILGPNRTDKGSRIWIVSLKNLSCDLLFLNAQAKHRLRFKETHDPSMYTLSVVPG